MMVSTFDAARKMKTGRLCKILANGWLASLAYNGGHGTCGIYGLLGSTVGNAGSLRSSSLQQRISGSSKRNDEIQIQYPTRGTG